MDTGTKYLESLLYRLDTMSEEDYDKLFKEYMKNCKDLNSEVVKMVDDNFKDLLL